MKEISRSATEQEIEVTPNQRDSANAKRRHAFCVAKAAPLSVVADRWR